MMVLTLVPEAEHYSMTIKTNCPACGKKKAIKHKVIFTPGDCLIETVGKGCRKCGFNPTQPKENK